LALLSSGLEDLSYVMSDLRTTGERAVLMGWPVQSSA
jgi:hypothetical protein